MIKCFTIPKEIGMAYLFLRMTAVQWSQVQMAKEIQKPEEYFKQT